MLSSRALLLMSALSALVTAPGPATAQSAGSTSGSTTTLGVQVTLPPAYESVVSSLGAIATSGATILKTTRSDARAMIIRAAMSKALLAAGNNPITTVTLDKSQDDPALADIAVLCAPRQNYIPNSVALNYQNTLVQNINAVSTLPASPTDIASALGLLFASSGYSIADGVSVAQADLDDLQKTALSNCQSDLSSYDIAYYGVPIRAPGLTASAATPAAVDTFAFLGPVGALIDTFLSVLQPVLINTSKLVDETRRRQAIMHALTDPATQAKIKTTGQLLAAAVDNYAAASRRSMAGSFVEQLVSIRKTSIDLGNVEDCKQLSLQNRSPSGGPNSAFISCWSAAWSKLKSPVDNLTSLGDSYDKLADVAGTNAKSKLGTILADFTKINAGQNDSASLSIFARDITDFINLANAVATAASPASIASLKAATQAVK
jgi:hypothetical protein